MLIISKYIDKDEGTVSKERKYINYIIPIIVSLITLFTCFLVEKNLNSSNLSLSVLNQQILTEPF